LHDAIQHGLHNEARHTGIVVHLIHPNKSLQKANHDDNEQREENEGFSHHNLEYDKHGAEEAEGVQIEQ